MFLGHSTVLIEIGGVRVLTDPVLRGRLLFLRRHAAPVAVGHYAEVDAVVLSHLHHDHCDLHSLALLGRDVRLIAPDGAGGFLRKRGFRRVVTLAAGESHQVGPVTVTATPAVHDGRREPFGPRAAAVGYLISDGPTVAYFAGDTDLFAGMRGLCPDLDLALIPVWGWGPNLGPGHLDPERAADAVELLRRAAPCQCTGARCSHTGCAPSSPTGCVRPRARSPPPSRPGDCRPRWRCSRRAAG
ncbi:MBL fold metallo-hydrolase [Catellatospora bangladeshensis]|uniref:MBL fold metallo-hydrolase n=1 Tax=Catellatospora bangladeshensis TaxID=310355 RepID=UPI00361D2EE9